MSASKTNLGIVVGVDGSPSSDVAIHWAARDAAMRNVRLTLVHVVNPVLPAWPQPPSRGDAEEWQVDEGKRLIADAIKLVEEDTHDRRPACVNSEVYFSSTVPTLVDVSKEAEMLVVGCRGRDAFSRVLLGSVSTGLVHHAHCPVAVIHDEHPVIPDQSEAPVLVGIDGSPASELATSIAFDQASRRGVELVALHAWRDIKPFQIPDLDWTALKSKEDMLLAERLAGWQERYPDVKVKRLVVCDRPAPQLIMHSDSAQLVVVGSHGRGGFAGMLLGSVSTAVVHGGRVPVIVARQS
jgi:nucleotide-binding universal stress UspA family protein